MQGNAPKWGQGNTQVLRAMGAHEHMNSAAHRGRTMEKTALGADFAPSGQEKARERERKEKWGWGVGN